ncbi:hypothetical protein roselon_02837 [Roseibacterium elongatum DSM 19469]|uniref:Uncharacterized protein n=2 Tax=Roseicyclus elongatus TaxID=159346 RepID=W8SRH2_9RHOB|nr:hypothetical protein roselon_02837 [Roseibacterium elongatum DSM 19469]
MLVVHSTPLVAEDLREMLVSAGANRVELAISLPDETPPEPFETCFLSVSRDALSDITLLDRVARMAAHVVLIVGFLEAKPDLPPGFSVLSEPFRDADVLAALLSARQHGGSAA